jgi:hypothetical protein
MQLIKTSGIIQAGHHIAMSIVIFTIIFGYSTIATGADIKTLSPPKTETPPSIDGILEDPCWETAAKGTDFYARQKGQATEPTDLYMCYDSENIYVALFCHDSQPDKIVATQTERDAYAFTDDLIWISFDTYHQHKTCDQFFVNAIGTQRDTRQRGTADKIEWKGDWLAAAKITDQGYIVEISIPFSLLNYPPGATDMGFNATRKLQRNAETSDWAPLDTGSDIQRYGDLANLDLPLPKDSPLTVMPYVLFTTGEDITKGRIGMDMKKKYLGDNTILLSVLPEFGTIEEAVKSIDFTYTAHRYMDNRPFFQEADNFFNSQYIYTPSIPDFDVGLKMFGRHGNLDYGIMQTMKLNERDDAIYKVNLDLPNQSDADIMVVTRDDDEVNNKVFSGTISTKLKTHTGLWFHGARSITADVENNGTHSSAGYWFSKKGWFLSLDYQRYSEFFYPASGYVDYPGSKNWSASLYREKESPGKSLRHFGSNLYVGRTWDDTHGLLDNRVDLSSWFELDSNIGFNLCHWYGSHIANYYEDDPGVDYYWNDDHMSLVWLGFNTDDIYRSCGISYTWGEIGGGSSETANLHCGFLPIKKLPIEISVKRAHRNNPEEGDIILWQGIFGARYEFSPEKSLSARVLYQEEGTNFTMSYRQQVRKGLDIFALFGDYNADKTKPEFSVKLVKAI